MVYFDMDGTLNCFYEIPDYVAKIIAEDVSPYLEAVPNGNFSILARYLNRYRSHGGKIGIISWLAGGNPTEKYSAEVKAAKMKWLKQHLPSVSWDEVHIVPYGYPKETFCNSENDILFDDEEKNRHRWIGKSFTPDMIIEIMKQLAI